MALLIDLSNMNSKDFIMDNPLRQKI